MDRSTVIVGAGRHGRNTAEIFDRTATAAPLAGFLDDTKPLGSTVLGHPVLAGFSAVITYGSWRSETTSLAASFAAYCPTPARLSLMPSIRLTSIWPPLVLWVRQTA
jgi:hypothetical protein